MEVVNHYDVVVSIIIGTYNRLDFLKNTIESLRNEIKKIPSEIIVVDGGSDDGSIEWLIKQKDIILIIQHNRGVWDSKPIERKSWGYFMNLGFKAASGKYVCMLSDDCLVVPDAINNGIKLFDQRLKKGEKVGAVAFYWRNWPEQQDYWVGMGWGNRLFINHGLYLNEALKKVAYIDSENYFFYHADGDLCLRLSEAGYKTIDSPNSYIEHYSDANTDVRASNLEQQKKDWLVYENRWKHLGKPAKDWILKSYSDNTKTADKYWRRKKKLLERFYK